MLTERTTRRFIDNKVNVTLFRQGYSQSHDFSMRLDMFINLLESFNDTRALNSTYENIRRESFLNTSFERNTHFNARCE